MSVKKNRMALNEKDSEELTPESLVVASDIDRFNLFAGNFTQVLKSVFTDCLFMSESLFSFK
jgi:hypothetical protein